jgi:pimeloyl-ACP methyl ester carboxylesterase
VPEAEVNGIGLYYEFKGSGEPLALVHGSWGDATSWRFVVPDWRRASVCSPMTAAATREASGLIRPEASTRTATTSLLCLKRLTWRLHMSRRTLGAATSP